ncbi:MAG: vanadium-dependent haloperoxidase [Gemmatimonadetes bacterium]|nr:vanadium-dependent haloperoxidase [Gemmatimonadota bacterium]
MSRLFLLKPAVLSIVIAAPSIGCSVKPVASDSAFVVEWMNTYYAVARLERLSPPVASRLFAYGAVALYEALALGDRTLRTLAGQLNGLDRLPAPDSGAHFDWPTVATVAESEVLQSILGESTISTRLRVREVTERQLQQRAQLGVRGSVREESARYGTALGRAIGQWASRDAYWDTRHLPYQPPVGRRYWVNTTTPSEYIAQSVSAAVDYVAFDNPAATLDPELADERSLLLDRPKPPTPRTSIINPTRALEPFWGRLRPFALVTAQECAPPPPEAYSEDRLSDFYREARAAYDAARQLTDEQRRIVFFWADNPGQTGTPPGHWISILAQVTVQARLSPSRAVEALALMAVGMADSFIGCWATKYQYNVVRPVTYVRRVIDRDWFTVVVTPPFPEYTSGHSAASSAAAEVLTTLLGDISFTDATHVSLGHSPRSYPSFRTAAKEAADSRLYGGIHYPMAIEAGLDQGRCVGGRVLKKLRTRSGSPVSSAPQ